jgi:hypothetical protein
MSHDTPQQVSSSVDAPSFPHHAAAAPTPLETVERPPAELQHGVPRWQPDDGDFN